MPTYTNLCILQGWLQIKSARSIVINRVPKLVLEGLMYTTDQEGIEKAFDDHHPVIITGHLAEVVVEIIRKMNERSLTRAGVCLVDIDREPNDQSKALVNQGRPYVIAQGRLVNHDRRTWIDIKHLSFLGLPWGAFDVLAKLASPIDTEFLTLVDRLSPMEKAHMNQALGEAMRGLLALREVG